MSLLCPALVSKIRNINMVCVQYNAKYAFLHTLVSQVTRSFRIPKFEKWIKDTTEKKQNFSTKKKVKKSKQFQYPTQ